MSIDPTRYDSANLDMRNRFYSSTAIVGSPATNAEVTVCQVTVTEDVNVVQGIWLDGWIALTIGTSGASLRLRIRRGGLTGAVVVDTGALTGGISAGNLVAQDCDGVDPAPVLGGQQYTLTATVGSGAATSTVSAATLKAIAV